VLKSGVAANVQSARRVAADGGDRVRGIGRALRRRLPKVAPCLFEAPSRVLEEDLYRSGWRLSVGAV
jgi:hypothetical protein